MDEMSAQHAEQGAGQSSKARKPTRVIMLAVLVAVVLAGAIAAGPTVWRVAAQRDTSVAVPDSIGNLVRDDSAQAAETADYLVSALRATLDLDSGAGAVYADPEQGPASSVILAVGTATLLWAERELDAVLHVLTDGTGEPASWQTIPAGDRGGALKCGLEPGSQSTTSPSTSSPSATADSMTICGWADHGSIALALFPEQAIEESAALLRDLRAATLSR